ncbi:MAG TPA: CheR family methyltransferase [Baekduia sp.]|nr:CheR family methyltransferase [Baekduia sp.]
MSEALVRVAELVRSETGVVIAEPQLPALAAALGRVAADMDAERFIGELAGRTSGGPLIARLVDEVTVKETYFFRELAELRTLDWGRLLKAALAGGADAVRIWVSACATGEEAYTFAILGSEALGTSSPPITILATDVSHAAIAQAAAATYSERALRNVPRELRERYFAGDAGRYIVAPAARSLVRFRHHNLVRDPLPPVGEAPFDVIACRNVLIYFDGEMVEQVIGSLEVALRPAGQLILGSADHLSGTARRLGRASLSRPVERRRKPRAAGALRRPLGLEDPRPRPRDDGAVQAPDGPPAPLRRRTEDRVEDALYAADAGDLDLTFAIIGQVLAAQPLNADAYFVRGLAELGREDAQAAVISFRRALYVDPAFGLAAFKLGRAHDARGDPRAATRAYEQALRTLDCDVDDHRVILEKVDIGDVAAACRARLGR